MWEVGRNLGDKLHNRELLEEKLLEIHTIAHSKDEKNDIIIALGSMNNSQDNLLNRPLG